MKDLLKSRLTGIIVFVVFAVASAIYFYPALEGKIIYAGDNVNGVAACREGNEYKKVNPEGTWWTGSMFSGMPNFQMGGHGEYLVDKVMSPVKWVCAAGNRNTAFIFLFYLCAFFLLLRAFDIDKWLSMAGAFAISLSSYFFVIIAAQHHGKCYSITWMVLAIVGFLLIYRKRYAWGAVMTALFTYIGFFLHPQMSYYLCMLVGILFFAELALAWKGCEWKHFVIATVVFFASFATGMGMGSANIFVNREYAAETMRGGHSDLSKSNDAANKTEGLDLDYATAWSEGRAESLTFLVPNFMGGASGYNLGDDSQLERDLKNMGVQKKQARQFAHSAPTYWGEKAFTSGPVYMGAVVCLLFVLALIIVPGPYKWALLVATLFSLFLSWGRNFMWLTEFFFKYFPMYNKFRAVESILIVAEITVPLLGFLALREIAAGRVTGRRLRTAVAVATGVTGGLCLFIALFGGGFDVTSSYDASWKGQVGQQIYDAILSQRQAMLRADAWRSLLFVLLAAAAVIIYDFKRASAAEEKLPRYTMILGIAFTVLVVADMWAVDKRFCNNSMFVSRTDRDKAFRMQPYEAEISKDTDYYRVLNLTTNTFNEARTSYYFKSIGGYSAAKLRRYQDLIDVHISKEMNPFVAAASSTAGFALPYEGNGFPVLNMLNMRYAVLPLQKGEPVAVRNPYAFGNAWFVDELSVAETPDEEIAALAQFDLHNSAVADKSFVSDDIPLVTPHDDNAEVTLLSYKPDVLEYTAKCTYDKVLVFSEIYYPHGWHLYIDDVPATLFRVNYTLRATVLPAGEHALRMEFRPEAVHKGNVLSMCCLGLFVLMLAVACFLQVRTVRQARQNGE